MIEEFRIVRVLGAGSFGIVYECQNTYLPETAAIKEFLPPELACRMPNGEVMPLSAQTEESFRWARDRFLQEAKTLWELARPERHPNIVRVTRYCEANGTAYMFMELEQGRSLAEILKLRNKLSPQELDAVFYPVMAGLERIHAAGVVHRDLKPANILIRADGSPVLIDFGAARRVVAGAERSVMSAYTPVYAALEQYHDAGEQGPWSDIYSFGATLYQAVTGRKPLSASERLLGGIQAPVTEECRGNYPQPILTAIDKALAIKVQDRPQSVAEWRRCMSESSAAQAADEETVVMSGVGPNEPTYIVPAPTAAEPRPSQTAEAIRATAAGHVASPMRRRWSVVLATASVLILGGIGVYYRDWLFPSSRLREEPESVSYPSTEPGEQLPALDAKPAKEMMSDLAARREIEHEATKEESRFGQDRSALPDRPTPVETQPEVDEEEGVFEEMIQPEDRGQQVAKHGEPTPIDARRDESTQIAETGPVPLDQKPKERELVFPGTRFSDPLPGGAAGPIMIWLPAGEFQMGSPPDEAGRNPDERLHLAQVTEPLAIGENEITVGQFRRFVENTGYRTEVDRESTCLRPNEDWRELVPDMSLSWESPGYRVTERHPVTCISWNDAKAYAEWLTAQTGYQYRLPTELEWEYAARAGTPASRFWGDDPQAGCRLANTAECDDDHTYSAPAGTLAPNPFGLRDTLGNLAEWTCSEYGKGYGGDEARCSESGGRSPRVFRGGSWLDAPDLVRSAARDGAPANIGLNTVGFRLVRILPSQQTQEEAVAGEVAERR